MGFRINTNVASLQAQNSVGKVNRETQESFAKLSSGNRITKSADDAAGLAISEKLKTEIRSAQQANRNANDGISMVQTAEGGLNETSNILTRMRELAIQSSSDTVGDVERGMTDLEYQQLKSEMERISQVTQFNGKTLLNGEGEKQEFQVGTGADEFKDRIGFDPGQLNSGVEALGVSSLSVGSKEGAQDSLASIDAAIEKVSGQRAVLGALQNRLTSTSNNLQTYTENMSAANSRIRDVDYAEETAKQARNSIIGSAGTSVLAQANMNGQSALKLIG
ncbi:flagellin N-terminal helical domain-containing protein [Peredibacter starrii]|uniref:Flagellin n=1 Tax=Peredibacter starrii TaxID=28202 RepID=A0AAX4HRQ4_9BACT|nr:flagellin [Peredibacter starrii]WPU65877.1 flagellin [Peredibacter starrii]